jgi:hypothetical protein
MIAVNGKDVRPIDAVMVDDIRRELKEVRHGLSVLFVPERHNWPVVDVVDVVTVANAVYVVYVVAC